MEFLFGFVALYPLFLLASAKTLLGVEPIYIGHVFYPPSMYFLAWTPPISSRSKELAQASKSPTPEWCRTAIDVSDTANFSIAHPQFLGGNLTNLQFHNYFSEDAYIERNGKRWGECYITPESGDIGGCRDGDRWFGWGQQTWSCWPAVEDISPHHAMGYEPEKVDVETMMGLSVGRGYTGAMERIPRAQETGKLAASGVKEAFTAVMTGSHY
ncbi:hypothetical protein DSL72_008501 [Monilinia vaccinii-corymbosi]|uniref:Uncharacterized protein n=1 Tax=Monilinia vaccinii-corymbosi TaxID=61207 RepID=A0A8A3PL21_9HELO|nr:hypothetical protein DSL72_008501 [Monilinia vaccinii-corymbosi]